MIPIEQTKTVVLVPPQIKDNGAPASLTYVDTKGWGHLRVLIVTGVIDAATTDTPLLSASSATGGTYTAITGATVTAIADGDDDEIAGIDVDLSSGKHYRYIKCEVTAGDGTTGTNLCVLGILSRPSSGANTGLATANGMTELTSV